MSNDSANPVRRRYGDVLVGGDVLDLVTSGMYTSPLAIYREYIQNATDSIFSPGGLDNRTVEIEIDVNKVCVTIRDNGPGLSYAQAKRDLIPIARSSKNRQRDRGFRGIGRLSGLAFGSSVKFLTRCGTSSSVTQVIWNGEKLRDGIDNKLPIEETILQCVNIERLDGDNYPANFFEVQIEGITRYAMSYIFNRDAVRSYLGEVCPVPFSMDFPYTSHISDLFVGGISPLTIDIYLDGEKSSPVTRPHQVGVQVNEYMDKFVGFESIKVPASGGEDYAAIGWIAHSSYLGALPKELGIRCLRARVGNIQVGSETAFDHLFSENRFNRWCVGEIHILDPRIVPNGRRDYFEPNVHLRNLENHLGAVCRRLERRCRVASRERNQQRHFQFFLESLEATYDLATSSYLDAGAARRLIVGKLSEVAGVRKKYENFGFPEHFRKLDKLEEKLINFRAYRGRPSLAGVDPSDVSAYKKVFRIIAETSSSPRVAKETIEAILRYKPS